ncbi:TlpA disulfide reductase family protein [Streptomyces lavendulocolor]|uniref:TlpA disulfide reductase family protein n=1 Tax=Streptomyces lavendulocolor TaxID=67316 RepID=A0ABV2WF96_9ACTN
MATVLAATVTACGTDNTATVKSTPTSAAGSPTQENGTEVTTVDNKKIKVPGDKPIGLFFFTPGCSSCAEGMKSLARATDTVGDKADVLAVDMNPGDSEQAILEFLRYADAAHLPVAVDQDAALTRAYGVSALSTLVVVDPAGKVTFKATDPSAEKIAAALTKAKTT